MKMNSEGRKRCSWAEADELSARYHDQEWGEPVSDDQALFERLVLEMFQAGLNWRLILHKREAFRKAFHGFSPSCVSAYTEQDVQRLLDDKGIIRNRKKIEAAIGNAKVFLKIIEEHGSFADYLRGLDSDEEALMREFKKRFSFMGPKIAMSFFQSVGMAHVSHEPGCWKAAKQTVGNR
jgi:DNA-3-methyladenine glycosylase I